MSRMKKKAGNGISSSHDQARPTGNVSSLLGWTPVLSLTVKQRKVEIIDEPEKDRMVVDAMIEEDAGSSDEGAPVHFFRRHS